MKNMVTIAKDKHLPEAKSIQRIIHNTYDRWGKQLMFPGYCVVIGKRKENDLYDVYLVREEEYETVKLDPEGYAERLDAERKPSGPAHAKVLPGDPDWSRDCGWGDVGFSRLSRDVESE